MWSGSHTHTVKNIRISTDIFCGEFSIAEPVPCTFVFVNRRNNGSPGAAHCQLDFLDLVTPLTIPIPCSVRISYCYARVFPTEVSFEYISVNFSQAQKKPGIYASLTVVGLFHQSPDLSTVGTLEVYLGFYSGP